MYVDIATELMHQELKTLDLNTQTQAVIGLHLSLSTMTGGKHGA